MAEPFNRVVVQVDMGDFAVVGNGIGVDRKAVILRGYFDPARGQVFHRLVPAVMPERQLISSPAKREP